MDDDEMSGKIDEIILESLLVTDWLPLSKQGGYNTPGAPLGLQDSKAVLNSHSVSIQEIFDHVQF